MYRHSQFNSKFPIEPHKAELAAEAVKILRFVAHSVGQHLPDERPFVIFEDVMSTPCSAQIWGSDNGWVGEDTTNAVYIAWEEGPYGWVHGGYEIALDLGLDPTEHNWTPMDAPGLAPWVWAEPATGWMLGVYDGSM